jgi:S-methylmethionine-dependent homocysteine/selenocysteine methylase
MNDVQGRLDAGEVVILDGAMGTELERRGVPMDDVAWDAAALATHPDLVREVHEDYIEAGAEVIITNTFATARHVLEPAGMGGQFRALNMRAVTLAKEAREDVADGQSPSRARSRPCRPATIAATSLERRRRETTTGNRPKSWPSRAWT